MRPLRPVFVAKFQLFMPAFIWRYRASAAVFYGNHIQFHSYALLRGVRAGTLIMNPLIAACRKVAYGSLFYYIYR